MLGDTLTFTVNSVAKVLKKINQDSYSSEYLLRETTQEFRAKVRHSLEKNLTTSRQMDRHNVELTQTMFADGVTYLTPLTRQVYVVIRNTPGDSATTVDYLSDALADWVKTNAPAVVGWES